MLAVLLTLAGAWGWELYQGRAQDRSTRSVSSCAQIGRLYGTVAQLAADDPSIPPSQVAALWQQRADRLAAQHCQ